MSKAVQFDEYGDVGVLKIVDVDIPKANNNEVVVKVYAAGINPGESKIRDGSMQNMFPAAFPSGEGSDLAGVIEAVGSKVSKFKVGDEVAGHSDNRSSHAEYVKVDENMVVIKPKSVDWEVAGALWVAGTTAYAAVNAVSLKKGDKVVISAAAGGVGSIAAQLSKLNGADVYGIVGDHDNEWLSSLGITPISYSEDVHSQIKTLITKPDAFIDTIGKGYVKIAIDLGVDPKRIDTIIDFAAVSKYGVKGEGSAAAADIKIFEELLKYVSEGKLVVPVAKTFPLSQVKDAFKYLESQHHRGKVVLIPIEE